MPTKRSTPRGPRSLAAAAPAQDAQPAAIFSLDAAAGLPKIGDGGEAEATPALSLPYPQGGWRVAAYLFAFFQPALGLALALLYWKGPDRRSRRFSRWCLGLALAGALLAWMGGAFWDGLKDGESGIQPW